jgi:alpha,alpha-trehalase
MRRALGALTPYDTLMKAIEQNEEKTLAGLLSS